ncbi:MAG: LacI family DNA-binding transcriptional regulator [Chitinivibrionia bacterium]|nr:LacI family DNA-binding transcriptional regulator [Chitinivibrionia bacterium]
MRRATISDVAKKAGVTKASVSIALRNKPGVSDELRNRVNDIAAHLGYVADSARNTRGKQLNFQLALLLMFDHPPRVTGSFGGSYLGDIINGFVFGCHQNGSSSVLSFAQRDKVELKDLTFATRKQVDAVVVRGWMPERLLTMLKTLSMPFLMLDCERCIPEIPQVKIDNLNAMELLVERLVNMGRRRFATITGDLDHANGFERLAGLQASLGKRGLRLEDPMVIRESCFDEESGRRGCRSLLAATQAFDALICHNDLIAFGAIDEMRILNPALLRKITVTGFDNMEFRTFVDPPILSVDPKPFELGRYSAELIARHVSGNTKLPGTTFVLPCELTSNVKYIR